MVVDIVNGAGFLTEDILDVPDVLICGLELTGLIRLVFGLVSFSGVKLLAVPRLAFRLVEDFIPVFPRELTDFFPMESRLPDLVSCLLSPIVFNFFWPDLKDPDPSLGILGIPEGSFPSGFILPRSGGVADFGGMDNDFTSGLVFFVPIGDGERPPSIFGLLEPGVIGEFDRLEAAVYLDIPESNDLVGCCNVFTF